MERVIELCGGSCNGESPGETALPELAGETAVPETVLPKLNEGIWFISTLIHGFYIYVPWFLV